MLIILTIQSMIFSGIMVNMGTVDKLNKNAKIIFSEKVSERRKMLESKMALFCSNFSSYSDIINKNMLYTSDNNNIPIAKVGEDKEYSDDFLKMNVECLIDIIRYNEVTGAFIILESNRDSKNGIYFRDMDPSVIASDNSDILGVVGSASILKELGIPFDILWQPQFNINEENKEFYERPFNDGKTYIDLKGIDLGYWSKSFRISENDIEVFTYTIPLLDGEHNTYGILGVEVSVDYIQKMLPYGELDTLERASYMLGMDENNDNYYNIETGSGPHITSSIINNGNLLLNAEDSNDGFYILKNEETKKNMVIYEEKLNMYNSNTPNENEVWNFMGIIGEKELFKYSNEFRNSMILSFIIAFIIGIIGIVIVSAHIVKPIQLLALNLKRSNPCEAIEISKTNIWEIDELVIAIEKLNKDVKNSASRFSKIMDVINLPMGAIEWKEDSDIVFCTEKIYDLLEFSIKFDGNENLDKGRFEKEMSDFKSRLAMIDGEIIKCEGNIIEYNTKDYKKRWIRFIVEHKNNSVLIVVIDETDMVREKKKIEKERDYDILTGLLNRRAFYSEVEKRFRVKHTKKAAFIMWDLDNLKYINDTYGHDYGDKYIYHSAEVFKRLCDYGALVSRISGDEFMAFLDNFEEKEEMREIIYRIHNNLTVKTINMSDGSGIKLRASGGIAWYPEDGNSYEELIRHADFTMYDVKNSFKGGIKEFDENKFKKDELLLSGKELLNKLIDERIVKYVFQPIVSVKDGSIYGFEALMRPQIEILKSPYDVMRIAKAQSKLYQIEKLTWMCALEFFNWEKEGFADTKVFVNSLPNVSLSKDDLDYIEEIYGHHLDRIIVEIIESENYDSECIKIKQKYCERWKSKIAIDDYGTGNNAEVSLLYINPDIVKIDRTFISGIDTDKDRQLMVKTMLEYMKAHNITTIGEGVETKEEMDMLISLGIDLLQGYYIGMPEFEIKDIPMEIKTQMQEAFTKTKHYDKLP